MCVFFYNEKCICIFDRRLIHLGVVQIFFHGEWRMSTDFSDLIGSKFFTGSFIDNLSKSDKENQVLIFFWRSSTSYLPSLWRNWLPYPTNHIHDLKSHPNQRSIIKLNKWMMKCQILSIAFSFVNDISWSMGGTTLAVMDNDSDIPKPLTRFQFNIHSFKLRIVIVVLFRNGYHTEQNHAGELVKNLPFVFRVNCRSHT